MMPQDRSDHMWAKIDKCPNCDSHYSRKERASIGADEEYCCGWCKREAEAPSGHPQDQRFHPLREPTDAERKSEPEHQAQMKWARDVVSNVVIPPAVDGEADASR